MSKKVISFALWGNKLDYNVGAVENAKLALLFYPEFECWFYVHKQSVPKQTIIQLKAIKNTKIIFKDIPLGLYSRLLYKLKPSKLFRPMMTWQFEAIDDPDVEVMLCRNTATRILLREKLAVEEWLSSGRSFHIMRDHPYHHINNMKIPGGMFGTRKLKDVKSWKEQIKSIPFSTDCDRSFLNCIYPVIKNDVLIHSILNAGIGETVKAFPIAHCRNWKFVGQYIGANGLGYQEPIYILRRHYKKTGIIYLDFSYNNYTYHNILLPSAIEKIISKQDHIPKLNIFLDLHREDFPKKIDGCTALYLSGENNITLVNGFNLKGKGISSGIKVLVKNVIKYFLFLNIFRKILANRIGNQQLISLLTLKSLNNKKYAILTNDVQSDYILNFPYLFYLFWGRFDKFIKVKSQKLYRDKSKFCAFVVSSLNEHNRINFFHKLSKYKKIDSYGEVLNNSKISEDLIKKYKYEEDFEYGSKDDLRSKMNYNALNQELFREYKFVICFENSCAKDYITEKLPNVMMANSIGIYRGAPNVDEFFNTDSFINYDNYGGSYDKMIEKIIELDQDDEKYNAMLDQPFFSNNKFPPRIETAEKDLEDFILKVIKK